jgi:predicted enzyme related to lactoylglutathione lyase
MPNPLSRFAINADDVARAKAFYQQVFGWKFEPDPEGNIAGAMQYVPTHAPTSPR